MDWQEKDRNQITSHGLNEKIVNEQLEKFKSGAKFSFIERPCQLNDGILKWSEAEAEEFSNFFRARGEELRCVKFVPASGAATRMFRHLHNFVNGESSELTDAFFQQLDKFAFYQDLPEEWRSKVLSDESLSENEKKEIAEFLLAEDGWNFGNLPKGLIRFHRYESDNRTAFEEHLYEGLKHLPEKNPLSFHFTVAPGFEEEIHSHLKKRVEKLNETGRKFSFSFSKQEPATDTIAVDLENKPFRDEDENLVFRPGGHGSLINNLKKLDADIVFIKNIDNVVHADHRDTTIFWKKALGGFLLKVQGQVYSVLRDLETKPSAEVLDSAEKLLTEVFGLQCQLSSDEGEKKETVKHLLDRPIRVCGMVKNEGEPGGGPYWVKDELGVDRPQIVEKAQIELDDAAQFEVFNSATHFNPVDLVCSLKSYNGNLFDLEKFMNSKAFFIAEKSLNGKPLKALEHPGLWNGAMAEWNTLFVEVPLETFSPVKTVNDLLRPLHQPK